MDVTFEWFKLIVALVALCPVESTSIEHRGVHDLDIHSICTCAVHFVGVFHVAFSHLSNFFSVFMIDLYF